MVLAVFLLFYIFSSCLSLSVFWRTNIFNMKCSISICSDQHNHKQLQSYCSQGSLHLHYVSWQHTFFQFSTKLWHQRWQNLWTYIGNISYQSHLCISHNIRSYALLRLWQQTSSSTSAVLSSELWKFLLQFLMNKERTLSGEHFNCSPTSW